MKIAALMPPPRRPARLALAAALLAAPLPAMAQTAHEDSVLQRARPEFKPFGIELDALLGELGLLARAAVENKSTPMSSFLVFPKVSVRTEHDSNIFRTDDEEKSDQLVVVSPALTVVSDWSVHRLELKILSDIARYDAFPTENYEDVRAEMNGRLDVTNRVNGTLALIGAQRHEPRGDPDDPGSGVAPIVFHEGTIRVGAEYVGDPVLLRGGFESTLLDFQDSGGFDADERDRIEHRASLRLGYEFVPGTTVFVEGKANTRNFNQKLDNLGFEQNSHGYEVLLGGTWDVSGVTFAEFGFGFITQSYDDRAFATIRSTTFNGKMVWNPTDLLTVTAKLERTIDETQQVGVAGILRSRASTELDYELLDNAIVSLGLGYTHGDYRGTDRVDHGYNAKLGLKYLFNRNMFTELSVQHNRRESNLSGEDFKASQGSLRVGAQL